VSRKLGAIHHILRANTNELFDDGLYTDSRLPLAAYVRLRLDRLLRSDYKKVLYLDADTRVMAPLSPLFDIEFQGRPLAAAKDIYMYVQSRLATVNDVLGSPQTTDYFNSGVMLMNWPMMLKMRILSKALDYALRYPERCKACDQDALNGVIAGDFVPLDPRWNMIHYYYQNGGMREVWIKHFTGEKPWSHKRPRYWEGDADWYRTTLEKSPWPDFVAEASLLGRFSARDVRNRLRNYNRVLGSIFVPFLQSSGARERATRFLEFKPEEVINRTHAWMDKSTSA
jgi:lipopolysaccharide biosynthesis glycosyltransferase